MISSEQDLRQLALGYVALDLRTFEVDFRYHLYTRVVDNVDLTACGTVNATIDQGCRIERRKAAKGETARDELARDGAYQHRAHDRHFGDRYAITASCCRWLPFLSRRQEAGGYFFRAVQAHPMKATVSRPTASRGVGRQTLLKALDSLAKPDLKAFRTLQAPASSDLNSYRLIPDRDLRLKLVAAGLAQIVQSPGPGNWTKTRPPPYIARLYPNFDAPTSRVKAQTKGWPARVRTSSAAGLPNAIVDDLRSKWEAYYRDTRPDLQRQHEQRAQSLDPAVISTRANELLSEARRMGRAMTSRDAVLQATDELTADFERAMRTKYGDLVVDILGIPSATDTTGPRRR